MKTTINEGVFWMILASFCFALMNIFVKILSTSLGILEITFFRNIFGVLFVLIMLYKAPLKQIGGKPWLLFFRGFMGFVSLLALIYNVAHISLAEAMTFSKTAPIFIAIISYFLLKETLGFRGWFAVIIGFVGIIFIMQPLNYSVKGTDIIGLFSGFGAALAYSSVKELRKYYDTKIIVLSFVVVGSLGPLLIIGMNEVFAFENFSNFFGITAMPKGITWFYIVLMGFFGTGAQIFLTKAFGFGRAGIVAAAGYLDIVFVTIFSAIIWNIFPNLLAIFGIILVIVGGLLVAKEKK